MTAAGHRHLLERRRWARSLHDNLALAHDRVLLPQGSERPARCGYQGSRAITTGDARPARAVGRHHGWRHRWMAHARREPRASRLLQARGAGPSLTGDSRRRAGCRDARRSACRRPRWHARIRHDHRDLHVKGECVRAKKAHDMRSIHRPAAAHDGARRRCVVAHVKRRRIATSAYRLRFRRELARAPLPLACPR